MDTAGTACAVFVGCVPLSFGSFAVGVLITKWIGERAGRGRFKLADLMFTQLLNMIFIVLLMSLAEWILSHNFAFRYNNKPSHFTIILGCIFDIPILMILLKLVTKTTWKAALISALLLTLMFLILLLLMDLGVKLWRTPGNFFYCSFFRASPLCRINQSTAARGWEHQQCPVIWR